MMEKENNGEGNDRPGFYEATRGEYKGHPVITLPIGGGRGFTFGLTKARAILDHLEEIEKFVLENG